jgi:hypothetical protein
VITLAKIYSPNKDYNGISANVLFVNGVGETNIPHLINWFKEHGYTVKYDAEELNIPVPKDNDSDLDPIPENNEIENKITDYAEMDFQSLKSLASEKGINTYRMKKAEIINELQRLEG